MVLMPIIIPLYERTTGRNGSLLVWHCRIFWSTTESRYLLTSQDGLLSCSSRLMERASLYARRVLQGRILALCSPMD